jgi:hypothetical protein
MPSSASGSVTSWKWVYDVYTIFAIEGRLVDTRPNATADWGGTDLSRREPVSVQSVPPSPAGSDPGS